MIVLENEVNISIRKNYIYNVIYEVVRIIVPVISTPYISRVFFADTLGYYTLAQTYSQFFVLVASLGFSVYGTRELATARDNKEQFKMLFWNIFYARFIIWSIAICGYGIFIVIMKAQISDPIFIYYIFLFSNIFDISYYFSATEKFKIIALRNSLVKIVALILVFLLIKNNNQIGLYTLIIVGSELVGQFIMMIKIDKELLPPSKICWGDIKKHIKISFTFFIPSLAIQLYRMVDKVMIGMFCGNDDTAFYEYSQKLVCLASGLSTAMVSVNAPRMSYYYLNKKELFSEHFYKIFDFVNFLSIPMCFGLIAISDGFSAWYYGSSFIGIGQLIKCESFLIIALGWTSTIGYLILIPAGKQKYYSISVYCNAIINIMINILLIPVYGAIGAVIASVISEFACAVIMISLSKNQVRVYTKRTLLYQNILASIIMYILIKKISLYMDFSFVNTLVEIVLGVCSYFIILVLMKNKNAIELVSNIKTYLLSINKR